MSPSASSTSPAPFDNTLLLHSSYDLDAEGPRTARVSFKIIHTAESFMNLVRAQGVPPAQIEQFITFLDDDRIFPICPAMVPELRYHPSESKAPGGKGYMDGDLDNAGVARVLEDLAHRLPAAPGEKAPMTAGEKAFQGENKKFFEEMEANAAREAAGMKEYFDNGGTVPPLPDNLVLRVGPVTTFGEIMKSMKTARNASKGDTESKK